MAPAVLSKVAAQVSMYFEKAFEQNVNVQIPSDFVTAPPLDLNKKFESAEKNATQESATKKEASEEVSGASKRIGGKDSTMAVANPPGSSGVEAE